MRVFEAILLLLSFEGSCIHVLASSSGGGAVAAASTNRGSISSSSSSSQPLTTRGATSRNSKNVTSSRDNDKNISTSEKESSPFSLGKWMAERTNNRDKSTSEKSSTTPPPAKKPEVPPKTKSDRERGWPLWFPRNDDSKKEDKKSSSSSTKTDTTTHTSNKGTNNNHSEDSKPSRTLRQALTHHHTDDHPSTNTSTHQAYPSENDCKSVEELKIVLLDSSSSSSSSDKDRRHAKKDAAESSTPAAVTSTDGSSSSSNVTTTKSESSDRSQSNTTKPIASAQQTAAPDDGDDDDDEEEDAVAVRKRTQSTQQQQQLQQLQQQPNIIVLGGAPFGVAMGGEPPRRVPLNSRGMPMNVPQQQQPPTNTVVMAEVMASLIGTFIRLWFLTWITKRIAMEEELIHPTQHFVWERLNDRYSRDAAALHNAISSPPLGIPKRKWQRHVRRAQGRHSYKQQIDLAATFRKTVVVVELSTSDHKGSLDLSHMTEVITFVLQQHRSHAFGTNATTITTTILHENGKQQTQQQVLLQPQPLEVVFLIESGGGGVGTYGLAAAQMKRLTQEPGITTTACVDLVAASGGYMIASQATQLLAAPFATLGSIGVMMEGLNFYDALQKYGVSPLILKSGSSKNPLSTLGPVSRKDIEMEQGRLEKVHDAFRQLVLQGRPVLVDPTMTSVSSTSAVVITPELEKIMDGSVFLGQEALALRLVDAVKTSEEYILERIQAGDRVLKLHRSHRSKFGPARRLSLLDLLPHLQSWTRGVMQTLGRWTDAFTTSGGGSSIGGSNSDSMSAASLRFLQVATVMGLAKHLIQHLQRQQHSR